MSTQIVLVTVPNDVKGREIATALVTAKLAACVNIIPKIKSIYHWEGAVQEDQESLLIIKTAKQRLGELEKKITELHPYSIPEFVVVESSYTAEKYSAWLLGYLAES